MNPRWCGPMMNLCDPTQKNNPSVENGHMGEVTDLHRLESPMVGESVNVGGDGRECVDSDNSDMESLGFKFCFSRHTYRNVKRNCLFVV